MGGSTADTPTTPEFLRASDAERDHAVGELRNEFAEGRLSHDTFMYRMQTALDARHRGQLAGLFTDLPPRRPGLMARIKAVLRGEPPPGPDQPDGRYPGGRYPDGQYSDGQYPGTQRVREVPGAGPPGLPWAPSGLAGPRSASPPSAGPSSAGPLPAGSRPASPVRPAPLFFPPGGGVRFTIGRTRECDLCLADLSVSRMHALLVRREDGWLLSDLGSHNGTRLNGWLVREPVPVRPGDRVEFGSMVFIVQDEPPPGEQAAAGQAAPGQAAPGQADAGQAAADQPPGPGAPGGSE